MSWEAWGDPPDPPELDVCPDCLDLDSGTHCETCNGTGEIERVYEPLDDDWTGPDYEPTPTKG
jgi:hypothetical protein